MNETSLKNNSQESGEKSQNSQSFQLNQKDKSLSNLIYFSERAKKMATAIYIVTNLIPQTDPLRQTIREFSIKLLTLIGTNTHGNSGYSIGDVSTEVATLGKKIVDMLEVAFFGGYVSEMNFSVLKSEFDIFLNEISDYKNSHSPIEPSSLKIGFGTGSDTTGLLSFGSSGSSKVSSSTGVAGPSVSRKPDNTASNIGNSVKKDNKNASEAKKTSRKESIISIIKMKGKVSIKDISSVIINCSEKTIQRELMALVSEGILKKSGDRRWSVYSLA